jgi:hypothetical protein
MPQAPMMPYPESTPAADVPCFVAERPAERLALLWHPALTPTHENVRLTVGRYRARGWRTQFHTERAALITPMGVAIPRAA